MRRSRRSGALFLARSVGNSGTLPFSVSLFALSERKKRNDVIRKYHAAAGKYAATNVV
jgi:hypothetical protein